MCYVGITVVLRNWALALAMAIKILTLALKSEVTNEEHITQRNICGYYNLDIKLNYVEDFNMNIGVLNYADYVDEVYFAIGLIV
jgi:predicted class III extradiol MEMO1 family dioxygenase